MFLLKSLSRLPLGLLYVLTDCLYLLVYRLGGFRRGLSLDNLRRSFPQKSEAELEDFARQSYHNAFDMIAEVVKGAALPPEQIRRRMMIRNLEVLAPQLSANKPVVLLASHHCNWEWLLLAACHELKAAAEAIVDDFDPAHHRSVFTTKEQERASDEEFLSSGGAVHCFFEEEAFLPDGTLGQPKHLSINKIGHAQHDLDPTFERFTYTSDLAGIAADIGMADALALQDRKSTRLNSSHT